MSIHPRHIEWIEARGLDPVLAEKLGLATVQQNGGAWLAVPYRENGQTINHKYRLTSEKRHRMDEGAPLALWNADCLADPKVRAGQTPVVITEGEWDAMAAIQAGFLFAVSVPNGAPAKVTSDLDGATRYDWVDRHAEALSGVKEFVLASDDDEAGWNLRADLVALLGAERCRFVEYPTGSKDLNEVLLAHGPSAVAECIATAKAYPVQGLYGIDDFPERGEVQSFSAGVPAIGELIYLVPGTVTVLTGYANSGKSSLMDSVIAHAMREHFPVCVASFETDVKPILRDGLRASLLGCGHHELPNHPRLAQADQCIRDQLAIISQSVDEDMEMDLEKFLSLARTAIRRRGVKMIVLDPWNELEHKRRRDESETEYISRALRAIKRFAKQYDVAFWIVAHPAKPIAGSKIVPGLYEISGCYSDDTEVLTRRGWLRHADLAYDDEIACFDPITSETAWHRPSRIIRKRFSGEMYAFKGYGYDLLVTPDHRMVVQPQWKEPKGTQTTTGIGRPVRWPKGEWSFCEAANLPSAPFQLPLAGRRPGGVDTITPNMAALAGWYVSEGCAQSAGVSISQAQGKRADEIEALLIALSIPYNITRSAPGGKGGTLPMQAFYIGVRGARDLVQWLRSECGVGSANKRIPSSILEGGTEVREAFLSAYLAGDGSYHAERNTHSACTTSPRLRDEIQRLAIELGYSCCWSRRTQVSSRHAPSWHINLGTNGRCQTAVRSYRNMSVQQYEGDVWCLTVPTGAYFVRRNGKALACGNSAHWANKADYGLTYHRPKFDENRAKIIVNKVRKGLPGRRGQAEVMFDFRTSSFVELEGARA